MRTKAMAAVIGMLAALCSVTPGAAHAASSADQAQDATASVYEAEDATVFHGTVDSDHLGFTGTGFVNSANESGAYVEFAVDRPAAGAATLALRYSNGTDAARAAALGVNGTAAPAPDFGPTADWDTWAVARLPVTLRAGRNLIRVTATTAGGLPDLDSLTVADQQGTDWADAMADSTMHRYTPATVGGWSYPVALYMMGQYQLAQRTADPVRRAALVAYVKAWADRFVDASGHIANSFTSLDSMMPGQVMIALYRETGQTKYGLAAKQIHDRLLPGAGYPTTPDGGFWHADSPDRADQLWSDGTFMADPFMAQYGRYVGDSARSFDIATQQLVVYASHLQQPDGLMKHAYDASKSASWADPATGLAPEYWCRAVGWYGVAATEILDLIPADHPRRVQLTAIVRNLVRGMAAYQDPASGRWFQVVDKGGSAGNWTETSCSAMFTQTIETAIARGYVPRDTYQSAVTAGRAGVLARISLHSDGLTYLTTTSVGTNVGDYTYYVNRPQATNDLHGLGAFLYFSAGAGG
ncbi:glycoside hydrolase family 88 protein [Actinacidiphila bryophytorum]|uniref:Unsaturated rhamnogalacturonyl hydrolase n=1 Tax=Actinacidiphila bryophytorum TaxID=1436133 RepID=A0A9W4H2S2_9ACTN|nr:glycoside hydrolase family 88 protein [Actinacidiphila bryophytorum]MBM9437000.1 glycoside hydrolase family 88 protein [Actinacidiphila bryophytorum]MBN6544708.1 glycoside hydrolase family 88 protein [Actinacidiphila bryophytorum]CAG7646176.1 Unsaturated rhamnogalacturonyl hydrolase [Actinacidiphila bryophytorum]